MKRRFALTTVVAALAVAAASAYATEFAPTRPLVIVVPLPPGGTTDLLARLLAEKLSITFRQPVLVENRPGAATAIGARFVLNAPADGQTMFMATFGTIANPYLNSAIKVSYTDFDPVSLVINTPNVLVVGPEAPYMSVADLVAAEKAKPGSVNFASTSNGGSPHLSGALLNRSAGVRMVHVPYPGSAPAITDLLGGHVAVMFDNLPAALPQINAGKVRVLAVTTSQRVSILPNVPTFAESGFPNYEVNAWFGMLARKGTPPEAVQAWSKAIKTALDSPDMRQKLLASGAIAIGSSPASFAAYLKAEDQKWSRVIREANIHLD